MYVIEQLFVFGGRDLKTQNVFMKKKGNICKIGETVEFLSLLLLPFCLRV